MNFTSHHILLFLVKLWTHEGDEFVISLVNRCALFGHLPDFHFATMEVTDTNEVDEGGMATTIESGFPHVVTESFEAGSIHESSATLAEKLSNLYGTLDGIMVGLISFGSVPTAIVQTLSKEISDAKSGNEGKQII